MKKFIQENISIGTAVLVVLVVLGLAMFCQSNNFSLILPLLFLFLGLHLFFFKRASLNLFLNLGLLIALTACGANAMTHYTTMHSYFIPVAGIAMLTMLLFNDLQLAFIMSFICSVLVSLIVGENTSAALNIAGGQLGLMLTYFLGSLAAIFSVRDARTRSDLLKAGVYVGLIQVICVILLNPNFELIFSNSFAKFQFGPLIISGLTATFVVMAFSKVFESAFGVLTNFSLLEMSDFNHPLLKRMVLEAPGTYHHSLIVSNLSEAAADAIGANALLTRVGAYYHDIGKMVKPEYFTENQLVEGNKHDKIEPSMSKLVILNHVKEGMDLAKKNKLNPLIIEFIPQHHGTSLMYYFYKKALEESKDKGSIKEEDFRYPGPKPQTRETAIVMLADSVEGATRAIDEPNPNKIEEVVRKIINNKFIDAQLDECNLTLKEIERIAVIFTRVLSAMYHGRVKYPEQKKINGNNSRKSPEADSTSSSQDNQNNKTDS